MIRKQNRVQELGTIICEHVRRYVILFDDFF